MRKEIFDNWMEALSIGGSYRRKKGRFELNDADGGFCCLGVLADMQGANWKRNEERENICQFSSDFEPAAYLKEDFCGISIEDQRRIADINDNADHFDPVVKELKAMVERGDIILEY